MPNPLGTVIRCLRHFTAATPSAEEDAGLLTRFTQAHDQEAFAALVRRHGPLVLGVGRRLLDDHGAEDVFQATFLMLARKPPTLRGTGSLAAWLHRVAWRLAMKSRTETSRRRHRETVKGSESAREEEAVNLDDPLALASRREVRQLMEEELGQLPEAYRSALVLCYLEGLTNEEAALRLSCPVGSIKSRLSRGRDLLSSRLMRRGLSLAAPLIGAVLVEASAGATVPLALLDATVQAATLFAGGQAVRTAGVSAGAADLVQGALRAMMMQKLKWTIATVTAIAVLAGVGAVFFPRAAPQLLPPIQAADDSPAVFTLPAETPQVKADREAVVKGNTAFALDLYKRLAASDKDKNLFLSPYSISTALAMTYAGARTQTAEEMAKALHFPVGQDRLHPAFAGLIGRFQANKEDKGYQLSVANALWGQVNYPWQKDFLRTTQGNYAAGLRQVDFMKDSEAARQTINAWVEEQTKDKIKELIKPKILDENTRLVLTNAIYFKGDWQAQFDKKLTQEEPFFGATEMKGPLMHRTGEYGYADADGFQMLEMPYKGDELSMVVLLPRKRDGLTDLEKDLAPEQVAGAIGKLRKQKVHVSLPKFKVTAEFKLKPELAALGIKLAFSDDADFSGMNGKTDLKIAAVIHKAFVDVNEEGTEAAAATAVVIRSKGADSAEPPVPVFRADHPFLFLIRDKQSGSVLFLGRLSEPAK